MNLHAPTLLLLALACGAPARAQDTTIFFEDFEGGFPAGWTVLGTNPLTWRHVVAGECGAASGMLAYNHPGTCDYTAAGPSTAALVMPVQHFVGIDVSLLQLSFDYVLDIDASGDQMQARITNVMMPDWVFLIGEELVNDGQRHSVVIDLPHATVAPWEANVLSFSLNHDGVGDLGRGLLIDDVRLSLPLSATVFCAPVGGSGCPCATTYPPFPLRGCPNSTLFGSALRGVGNPSVSADTYRLGVSTVPFGSPCLFFEGTAQSAMIFGDGMLCTTGALTRLGVAVATGGIAVLPDHGTPGISLRSNPPAGSTRHYQMLYRDIGGPCNTGLNLTNGWSVRWGP